MIKSISLEDIPQCVKVIRESFGTVAREFHITKEMLLILLLFPDTGRVLLK